MKSYDDGHIKVQGQIQNFQKLIEGAQKIMHVCSRSAFPGHKALKSHIRLKSEDLEPLGPRVLDALSCYLSPC